LRRTSGLVARLTLSRLPGLILTGLSLSLLALAVSRVSAGVLLGPVTFALTLLTLVSLGHDDLSFSLL
jgi:hypothetical protein